jgi:Protein of unknown function (DUF998)
MPDRRHLGAIAGLIGPPLFVAAFTIEGWFRPYRAREMFVTELSLGPRGWIQMGNFIATGVLLLLFTSGEATTERERHAACSLLRMISRRARRRSSPTSR